MGTKKSPVATSGNIIEDLKLYTFVLVALSIVWVLTGMGYFWPIWFLIGWVAGPCAAPYFKSMFSYSQDQLKTAQEQILGASKGKKTTSAQSKDASADDSDIAGA